MNLPASFDATWEDLRQRGAGLLRYPADFVVTFLMRSAPRDRSRNSVKVLEVACGAGNNLWAAASEGFDVTGIDGSKTAIAHAQKRFDESGLQGDLRVGDFTQLPFADAAFDLVIDRGGIVCCGYAAGQRAVNEVFRVLRPGGKFLFNPYSQRHSCFESSDPGEDGVRINIRGAMAGVGQLCYYNEEDVDRVIGAKWNVLSKEHVEIVELVDAAKPVHAEWRLILERPTT